MHRLIGSSVKQEEAILGDSRRGLTLVYVDEAMGQVLPRSVAPPAAARQPQKRMLHILMLSPKPEFPLFAISNIIYLLPIQKNDPRFTHCPPRASINPGRFISELDCLFW